LIALQNALHKLFHSGSFEEALISTVGYGGDTDTNAAIAGALLGAAHGREAIPPRWILPVLACRPMAEAGALRPRPMEFWPDDVLELAEALLLLS
jgi:ADP-ribosyl-[dinitrogen reductase] hydrolase